MTAQLRILATRLFPERQVLLRTGGNVQSIAVPGWLQAAALAMCILSVLSVGYLVARFIHAHHTIESREATASLLDRSKAIAEATAAEVRSELEAAKSQLADLSSQYDQAETNLAELSEENGKLKGDLGSVQARAKALEQASGKANQLAKVLEETKADLAKTEAQRTTLQSRIQQLQSQLQAATAQAQKAEKLASERRKGASALGKALEKFGLGKTKKSSGPDTSDAEDSVESSPSKQAAQASEPIGQDHAAAENLEHAAAEKPEAVAPKVEAAAAPAPGKAGQLERLIASTGLDISRLIGRVKPLPSGEGGPFVALDTKHAQGTEEDQKRLDELQKLVKTLPLSVPLAHYQVESPFGVRHDPFNGRESFHDGMDMSAPYRTPVYCTGPGTVVYAGSMGDYGRVVEVDHGHGIVSRYAHLHRVLVSRGQKVATHTEIGELGSSGRATGPHVHYEILIDGEPTDPSKFLQVGKNVVQVGDKQ